MESLLKKEKVTIRQLSQVVGLLVASLPGVKYDKAFHRRSEHFKNNFLKEHRGDYDAKIHLPDTCKTELSWWVQNITHVNNPIESKNPEFTLTSNASNTGWGEGVVLNTKIKNGKRGKLG